MPKLASSVTALVTAAVALTALFVFLLAHLWWLAGAAAVVLAAITAVWLWPREELGQIARLAP